MHIDKILDKASYTVALKFLKNEISENTFDQLYWPLSSGLNVK